MHVNLVIFKKDGTQKPYPLSSNVTVIGRRHDCDLRIPLIPVSRRHCKLSKNDDDIIKIHDLESSNGTFINGKRITEATVNPGDYIRVGPITFAIQVDGQPENIAPPKKKSKKPASKKPENTPQEPEQKLETEPQTEETDEITLSDSSDSFADLNLSDSFVSELKNL